MPAAIEIQSSTLGFDKAVSKLMGSLSALRMRELLDDLGQSMEDNARLRISQFKESPEGEAWDGWSDSYARTRESRHSLLQGEGPLLDSLTHNVLGADEVEAGSPQVYAGAVFFGHDYGDRVLPSRQALGIGKLEEEDLSDVAERWLKELL